MTDTVELDETWYLLSVYWGGVKLITCLTSFYNNYVGGYGCFSNYDIYYTNTGMHDDTSCHGN